MERQVTIQLLTGSIKNDVPYIHQRRDGLAPGQKVDDELLSLAKG